MISKTEMITVPLSWDCAMDEMLPKVIHVKHTQKFLHTVTVIKYEPLLLLLRTSFSPFECILINILSMDSTLCKNRLT